MRDLECSALDKQRFKIPKGTLVNFLKLDEHPLRGTTYLLSWDSDGTTIQSRQSWNAELSNHLFAPLGIYQSHPATRIFMQKV